jgi:hypothetical protein
MTLEQIDSILPNGLHDAVISSIAHNYETATVDLAVEVVWGLPDDAQRFLRRTAILRFTEVSLFTIRPPENQRIVGVPGSIWFIFWRTERSELPPKLVDHFPPDVLAYTIYILEWESSIHIVARGVSLLWPDSEGRL